MSEQFHHEFYISFESFKKQGPDFRVILVTGSEIHHEAVRFMSSGYSQSDGSYKLD